MLPEETYATDHKLVDFLYPAPARRKPLSILGWWERRRLAYNAIVGTTGIFTLTVVSIVSLLPPGPHPLAPIPWLAAVPYSILANLCYFLGPTAEIAVERVSRGKILPTGPGLFRMGLTFSVGLTLLPVLIVVLDWGFRVVRWIFGAG